MDLKEAGWLLLSTIDPDYKDRKFNDSKLSPDSVFKECSKLELSYTTMSNYKECKLKFFVKKILGLSITKVGEALFLGNIVHKFNEDLVTRYTSNKLSMDTFNDDALNIYDKICNLFDSKNYANKEQFVSNIYRYGMSRKKFEVDMFFDDITHLYSIAEASDNYVESNKLYFRNSTKLLKQLFLIAERINARNFKPEEWLRFKIDGLMLGSVPVSFLAKVDLIFDYDLENKLMTALIDFKTGKKQYFSWDQLNYYSVFYGEDRYDTITKYFFDIKECERSMYTGNDTFKQVNDNMISASKDILEMVTLYNSQKNDFFSRYEKKVNAVLKKIKKDNVHIFPNDLMMAAIDILITNFFKKNKIIDYTSKAKPLCRYCDVFGVCPIK
jgi:hypothetical protein